MWTRNRRGVPDCRPGSSCEWQRRAPTFFFQAEDGIRDIGVTGVQTCALPIYPGRPPTLRTAPAAPPSVEISRLDIYRSEERRVGKECRSRWPAHQVEKDVDRELAALHAEAAERRVLRQEQRLALADVGVHRPA